MSNHALQGGIAPIPTRYKGYHFRSRTEARWAVFLDSLDIPWQYEVQGFDLSKSADELTWRCTHKREIGCYLPDFFLPKSKCWLEVKGALPDLHFGCLLEECKAACLVHQTKTNFAVIVYGQPSLEVMMSIVGAPFEGSISEAITRHEYDGMVLWPLPSRTYKRAMSAIRDAKSARFEHGESGRT